MADVKILVTVDDKGAVKSVKALDSSLKDVGKSAKNSGSSFGSMFKKMAVGIGVIAGIRKGYKAITGFMSDAIEKAKEQERVEAQLNAVLKSTGYAAGLSAQELKNMAAELQKTTTFGDEAIIAGQNILLTFKNIGEDAFPRVTEAMLDLSTAMGMDLKSSAVQVGKALNDPLTGLTMLTRVGITFTESQKTMIKQLVASGDLMSAQGIILTELESQFKGSAAAAADTFGGKMTTLSNIWGDFKEAVGEAITKNETVLDIIGELTTWIGNLGTKLKENQADIKLYFSALFTAIRDTAKFIGKVVKGFDDLFLRIGKTNAAYREYIDGQKAANDIVQEGVNVQELMKDAIDDGAISVKEKAELLQKYGYNWREVVKAIAEGKEGKDLKDLFDELKTKTEDQAAALETVATVHTQKYAPAVKESKEKVKEFADYLKDFGIKTVEDKGKRVDELEAFLRDLNKAYADGKIDVEDYEQATREAKDEIVELTEHLDSTAIPAARDFGDVAGQALGTLKDNAEDLPESFKTATTAISDDWKELTDGIKTQWINEFTAVLTGSQTILEGFKNLFGAIKTQFFNMVAEMTAKWSFEFLGSLVKGTAGAAETVVGSVKDIGKSALNLAKGFSPGGMVATAIGTAVGTFLGGLIGPKGPSARSTELIKDYTWEAKEHLKNVVSNIDAVKWGVWETRDLTTHIRDNSDEVKRTLWGHTTQFKNIANNTNALVKIFRKIKFGATGLRDVATSPTLYVAGESGPERVSIDPQIKPTRESGSGSRTVNLNLVANFDIRAVDPRGTRDLVRESIGPEFCNWVETNLGKGRLMRALGS